MNVFEILAIVTCITSTVTMIMVAIAVLPHVRQGMIIVRDAVLWATLVLILSAVAWAAWQGIQNHLTTNEESHSKESSPKNL